MSAKELRPRQLCVARLSLTHAFVRARACCADEEYEADRVKRLGNDLPRPIKYASLATA